MKFLTLFLIFFSQNLWAQHVTGNGGEGVRLNGQVYLRDLVEYDLHLNPYIGEDVDRHIESLPLKELSEFLNPAQLKLLKRKLSELEATSPWLGLIVARGFSLYRVRFVAEPLLLVEIESGWKPIPQSARVQVAIRQWSQIVIHEPSWAQMNDANKIALLIHEMLYSFAKVEIKAGVKFQSSTAVWKTVGWLFQEPTRRRESFDSYRDFFALPAIRCEQDNSLELSRNTSNGLVRTLTSSGDDRNSRLNVIREICDLSEKIKPENSVRVVAKRLPFNFEIFNYSSSYRGEVMIQVGLGVLAADPILDSEISLEMSRLDCFGAIETQLGIWYAPVGAMAVNNTKTN